MIYKNDIPSQDGDQGHDEDARQYVIALHELETCKSIPVSLGLEDSSPLEES